MCKNDTHQLRILRQKSYESFLITIVLFLKYILILIPFCVSLAVLLFDTNTKCRQFQQKQNKISNTRISNRRVRMSLLHGLCCRVFQIVVRAVGMKVAALPAMLSTSQPATLCHLLHCKPCKTAHYNG
jgi:hypothetical protein